MSKAGPPTYGTAGDDAPVTRRDLERALRNLNATDLELRDAVLQLGTSYQAPTSHASRVVAESSGVAAESTTAPAI